MSVKPCYFFRSFPRHLILKYSDPLKSWEVLTRQIYIDINIDTGQDSVTLRLRRDALNYWSELQEFATALALYRCQLSHLPQGPGGLNTAASCTQPSHAGCLRFHTGSVLCLGFADSPASGGCSRAVVNMHASSYALKLVHL